MGKRDEAEMEAWAKKQTKQVSFDIPDREPGEEPITEKQLAYIKHLLLQVDESELRKLGKWQASSIIDQSKAAKKQFVDEKVLEYGAKRMGNSASRASIVGVIIVALVILIIWLTK